ncbi:MAG TPA: hypothetical protein VFA45_18490 [Actinomycetes bacterium]|jgi:hypothetical protein|nr:hypothetical protein [Actinomycetes bacterium]
MSEWQITAAPQDLTIPTGEAGRVLFTITNLDAAPRLASLEIEPDPGAADPSWFAVDAPAVVMPGRSSSVAVQVDPRVVGLEHGQQYTFVFHGRVGSAVSGAVSVTVAGPARWQVAVSPTALEVTSPGNYMAVYTVTNLVAEAATAVLEVPYQDPDMAMLAPSWALQYRLDESERHIAGLQSAAFTLRIYNPSDITVEFDDIVQGRVTTAGGGDLVLCPPLTINYRVGSLFPPIKRHWTKLLGAEEFEVSKPPPNGPS